MGGRRSARAKGAEPRQPGRLEAEAVAVTFAALALFAEGALLSYHPADPLIAHGARVENWCGPAGALVAGVLAGALGFAAHVLPLAGGVVAWRYLRGLPLRPRWIPLSGWGLCLLALAGGFEGPDPAAPPAVGSHAGRPRAARGRGAAAGGVCVYPAPLALGLARVHGGV